MAKQIRNRKSAPQNKVKSAQLESGVIQPWHPLSPEETRNFNALIDSREEDSWLDSDIEAATRLAKVCVEMDTLWREYQEEGSLIYTDKGWPAPNPKINLYNQMAGVYQKLRTSLGLTASQRGVSGVKQAGRNKQDAKGKKLEKDTTKITSLLARPK